MQVFLTIYLFFSFIFLAMAKHNMKFICLFSAKVQVFNESHSFLWENFPFWRNADKEPARMPRNESRNWFSVFFVNSIASFMDDWINARSTTIRFFSSFMKMVGYQTKNTILTGYNILFTCIQLSWNGTFFFALNQKLWRAIFSCFFHCILHPKLRASI